MAQQHTTAGVTGFATLPDTIAEIERLHAIEMDIANWNGCDHDLTLTPGGIAQGTMWTQVDAALSDPAITRDTRLMARMAKVVMESLDDTVHGEESRTRHVSRLLVQSVLSQAAVCDDAEIHAACTALDKLEHEYRALAEVDDQSTRQDEISEEQRPFIEILSNTRARTIAGIQAKARSLVLWAPDLLVDAGGDMIEDMTSSVLEDLIGYGLIEGADISIEPVRAAVSQVERIRAEVIAGSKSMHDEPFRELCGQHNDAVHAVASTPVSSLAAARLQARTLLDNLQFEKKEMGRQYEEGVFFNDCTTAQAALLLLKQLASPEAPIINPDADYIALCNEIVRLEAEWEATGRHQDTLPETEHFAYEEEVRTPIAERSSDLFDRLCEMQPQTDAGQRAAAQAVLAYMPRHEDGSFDIGINHKGENVAWMLVKQLAGADEAGLLGAARVLTGKRGAA